MNDRDRFSRYLDRLGRLGRRLADALSMTSMLLPFGYSATLAYGWWALPPTPVLDRPHGTS